MAASFENSFFTPEVVINGGEFHKKFWMRPKFLDKNEKDLTGYHVAAKLNGGTIHETLSVDKQSSDYGYAPVRPRLSYSDVTFLADEMLGKNVVQTGKGTFAAQDTSSYREYISYYNKSGRWSEGFVFEIKAVNDQPAKILPNAWGMKFVTLDGNPIDYFKDWKGAVSVDSPTNVFKNDGNRLHEFAFNCGLNTFLKYMYCYLDVPFKTETISPFTGEKYISYFEKIFYKIDFLKYYF